MQGKKRYLALILFIIIGLVTFSFANPEDQLEPVGDAVKKVDDSTELKEEKTEAEQAVEEAELLPSIETVEEATTIIQNTVTSQPVKDKLVNRVEEAKKAIDTSELVATVEKMVEEAQNKDDIYASEVYFTQNNVEQLTGNMEPGTVKENLENRIEYLNTIFNDVEAPTFDGIENGEITNDNVKIVINDTTNVTTTVTLNNEAITFAEEFDKEGVYIINAVDEAQHLSTITFTIDKTNPKFEGLPSREAHITQYIVDVTDVTKTTITLQKDHGQFIEIAEGYVINEEGTYQLVGLDEAGNKYTTWIIIDKTAPTISGVTNGSVVNKCENVYVFDRYLDKVVINDTTYTRKDFTHDARNENFNFSPEKICAAGTYTITATDRSGKSKTETFTIDKTSAVRKSGNYYINGLTKITELIDGKKYQIYYTKGDKILNVNAAFDEELKEMPVFTFYNNGKAYSVTANRTSYSSDKYYYHTTFEVPTEMVDGEITYVVSNIVDKAGNKTEDLAGPTNSVRVFLDKTSAKRLSTDFYVHGLTQVGKVFYTQNGNKITVNIKTDEKLANIPTFTLHTPGKDIVLTDVLDRGQDSNGKWLYQGSYLLENVADGEVTFTISNIVDRAGNATEDIKAATNSRRIVVDNTPNRITQSFFRGTEVEGLNYYLTNGNKLQFNIGFREMLGEDAVITIGGKKVELIYDNYYVATNSHMYYGYLEAAENETELVPGVLDIEISNITDYAGNEGFYYQTNGTKVYPTIKVDKTTNYNVAIYKIAKTEVSTVEEFEEAIASASEIELTDNIVLDSTIEVPEDKDLVIDLKDNTIEVKDNGEEKGLIKSKGNLTIKNGELLNNDINKKGMFDKEDGTLIFEDVTLTDKASYSGTTIYNRKGLIKINNSTINIDSTNTGCSSEAVDGCGNMIIENYGDVEINNSTLKSNSRSQYAITSYSGNITTNNVLFDVQRRGGFQVGGGNVTLNETTIKAYWYAVYAVNLIDVNITINSGYYLSSGYSAIYLGKSSNSNKGRININGGTFEIYTPNTNSKKNYNVLYINTGAEGQDFGATIKGGEFKSFTATKVNPENYVAEGYKVETVTPGHKKVVPNN